MDLQPQTIGFRLRLLIAVPFIVSIFMISSSSALYSFANNGFLGQGSLISHLSHSIPLWILLMTGLAFISTLVFAYVITRDVKGLISKAENLVPKTAPTAKHLMVQNELSALGIMLDEASVSLSHYIQDSYITDSLPEGVITVNRAGAVVRINKKAANVLGIDALEAHGKSLEDFAPKHESSRKFYDLIQRGFEGESTHMQLMQIPFHGATNQSFWVSVTPIRQDSGTPREVCISFKDQESVLAIRSQIQRLERLAAIGSMSSGIAHEVRNPLGAIRTFTELTRESLSHECPAQLYTEEILKQVDRLNDVIEDVLIFSKDAGLFEGYVNLALVLSEAVSLAKSRFPEKNVFIDQEIDPHLFEIKGNTQKLLQAILNILINAFEASRDGGRIVLSARCSDNGKKQGRFVCIEIADSGSGISADKLSRIFEPFFTTKPGGTGLGLAIAYHVITIHGGELEVSSDPQEGTRFHITLPEGVDL